MPSHSRKILITLLFFLFVALFYVQKINLTTADLGRHIKNGEYTLKTHQPVSTNFYSYTMPDIFVLNHHWLSGVVFYLLWKQLGFSGISIFYALLNTSAVYMFFAIGKKHTNVPFALAILLLTMPLITSRTEVRPEGFSYLLLAVYFYVLLRLKETSINFKLALFVLFILQILWVNTHIFFIFGIFLCAVFLADSLLNFSGMLAAKQQCAILTATVVASFFNPYGTKGFLEPLNIFKDYGYMIVENQAILFMQKLMPRFLYFNTEVFLIIAVFFVFNLLLIKNFRKYFVYIAPIVLFSLMAFNSIRMITAFGLFLIPFLCICASALFPDIFAEKDFNRSLWCVIIIIILFEVVFKGSYFSPFNQNFGIGLMQNIHASAQFFKDNNLKGPIFNNYDIGGYLIFNLYPQEKVFVDNRPEAYTSDFLQHVYISIQEDENLWKQADEKYGFNVIYFYRHDFTPWAQPFLIKRLKDNEWVPVFVDDYVLILVKNVPPNAEIIDKYRISKSMFSF